MARKSPKGYYVDGTFIVAGSDADVPLGDGRPSRTERKNASEELQKIGEELLTLRAEILAGLSLPEPLHDAIVQAKRLTNFGAKRRQLQYVGKLMRRLEPEALEAVKALLAEGNHRVR
jgi:ribosome-associated protein